jgi:P22 coat protein - gene protein 5
VANTLLTSSIITLEALAVLKNSLTFAANVNRQYDDRFAQVGNKIGDTLNVRKPPRYIGRTGQAISIEDSVESSIPVQLTTQFGVDIQFASSDLALRIDDFSDRFIKPAMATVANKIDRDGLSMAKNAIYNQVGTPGANGTTGITTGNVLLSGAKLDNNGCVRSTDMRSFVVSPLTQALLVDTVKSLFNPAPTIADQYKTGNIGTALGYKWSMDQNVINHTAGALGGTPLVNGASQTGNSLITNGWTAAALQRLNVGDTFTLAGVFSVNPQSRQSTGILQDFVVTANGSSDGAGNMTISISPAINPTGQFQNVTASPASGAALTITSGAANSTSTQNIAYHRDAFTLACADLPLPGGVDFASRKSDPQTGLSVRAVRQYNVSTDQFPCRLDVLYGWAPLYPEWACRVQA